MTRAYAPAVDAIVRDISGHCDEGCVSCESMRAKIASGVAPLVEALDEYKPEGPKMSTPSIEAEDWSCGCRIFRIGGRSLFDANVYCTRAPEDCARRKP